MFVEANSEARKTAFSISNVQLRCSDDFYRLLVIWLESIIGYMRSGTGTYSSPRAPALVGRRPCSLPAYIRTYVLAYVPVVVLILRLCVCTYVRDDL